MTLQRRCKPLLGKNEGRKRHHDSNFEETDRINRGGVPGDSDSDESDSGTLGTTGKTLVVASDQGNQAAEVEVQGAAGNPGRERLHPQELMTGPTPRNGGSRMTSASNFFKNNPGAIP